MLGEVFQFVQAETGGLGFENTHSLESKMRNPVWELALLAGLACLALGFAGARNDTLFGTIFGVEAGLATIEAFYVA